MIPVLFDCSMMRLPAGLRVRHEERISKLERDLAKLEVIVERLVSGMDAEHKAMKESRHEDRQALKELGEKMERSVSDLATEIKRLAEKNAANDSKVLTRQSQWSGALDALKWVIMTGLVVASIAVAYNAGQRTEKLHDYQEPHRQINQT